LRWPPADKRNNTTANNKPIALFIAVARPYPCLQSAPLQKSGKLRNLSAETGLSRRCRIKRRGKRPHRQRQ
jgi:hypothetical protein